MCLSDSTCLASALALLILFLLLVGLALALTGLALRFLKCVFALKEFMLEKVVHHVSFRGDGLSPDAGRCRFQVFPFDFRDQSLEGSYEGSLVV